MSMGIVFLSTYKERVLSFSGPMPMNLNSFNDLHYTKKTHAMGMRKSMSSSGIKVEDESIALGTLAAEMVPSDTISFSDDGKYDLDWPTSGFSSIPEALDDIRQGKMVVVVDGEDRENEGDLIMAASSVTPEAMSFFVKHGTGIVSFTVSVDAKHGTTTGVSASDRAATIKALASKESKPDDFNRPGHIFPLKYKEGGVLKRAGHTEASVDLVELAGFDSRENLKIVSIADLIRYRRKTDKLVERVSAAHIPTTWGPFVAHCYKSVMDGIEHVAMVKGDIGDGEDILVRVHSECLTGDIYGSARCDCGNQLALAMQQIEDAGRGVLVYLRGHEGRGIGLGHKLRAYNLQDDGRDTVEANEELGLPVDSREYGSGAQILRDLGVKSMKLMTNNPAKYNGLKGYGVELLGRVPLSTTVTKYNKRYLETKQTKMGHVYGPGTNGFAELINKNGKVATVNLIS
uniref:GTP cyclohydrolase II n=1 Tax=Tanacetum cinerariifolium TaxID=118510 RepID=A0A699H604_TANCI|nr:bifunctional riboflavin biosynthesis protein RIBA 1, chloroplastic-like [Tanacetum cinerariifolium]